MQEMTSQDFDNFALVYKFSFLKQTQAQIIELQCLKEITHLLMTMYNSDILMEKYLKLLKVLRIWIFLYLATPPKVENLHEKQQNSTRYIQL